MAAVRSLVLTVVALISVLALVSAPSALAKGKPEIFHEHIDETFPDDPTTTEDDLCGIPVTTHVEAVVNDQLRINKDGVPEFKGNFNGTVTWTNPATGLSVSQRVANAYRDISVTLNLDGTVTIITATTGLPEKLLLPDGTVLNTDVGRIVFEVIIDINDTPLVFEDDEFISQTIVSISGPHPDAESDFALFCELVLDALT